MTEGSTNRHSINCKLIRSTDKAWFIDDGAQKVWIPKSQAELYDCADGTKDLFAEEWILKAKGLI
jgi:hypothetical protein